MGKLINIVCSVCGSDRVLKDAYAAWSVGNQAWELHDTYDSGDFCEQCEGEVSLDEIELEEAAA